MSNPLNKLPADPAWLAKVQAAARRSAEEVGCLVVIAAVQRDGKTFVCSAHEDSADPELQAFYKRVTDDTPSLFMTLAGVAALQADGLLSDDEDEPNP